MAKAKVSKPKSKAKAGKTKKVSLGKKLPKRASKILGGVRTLM